jgi:small-conductance mechanosensitive channel
MSKNKFFSLYVVLVLFWSGILKADETAAINSTNSSVQTQTSDVSTPSISNEELIKRNEELKNQLEKAIGEIVELKKDAKISEFTALKDSNKKLKSDLDKSNQAINKKNSDLNKANSELKRLQNALNTIDEQIALCKGTPRDPNKSYGVSSPKKDVIWVYPAKPHHKDD